MKTSRRDFMVGTAAFSAFGGPDTMRDEDWDRWMIYANQGVYFDLVKDPEELDNAYSNPVYANRIAALKARLGELRRELGDDDRYGDAKEYGPIE